TTLPRVPLSLGRRLRMRGGRNSRKIGLRNGNRHPGGANKMRILLLVGDNRIQASLSTTLRSLTSPLRAKLQILRQMIPGLLPAHPLTLQPLLHPISIVPHTLLMLRLSSAKLILVGHAHNSRPRLSLKISPELVLASLQFRKTLSL